jgi:hypothetical protein
MVARLRNRDAAGALDAWLACHAASVARKARMRRYLQRWSKQSMASVFSGWLASHLRAGEQKLKVRRALGKMAHAAQAAAFASVTDNWAVRKRHHNLLSKAAARMKHGALVSAFSPWGEWAKEKAAFKLRLTRIVSRLLAIPLSCGLHCWREACQTLSRLSRAVKRLTLARALQALNGWVDYREMRVRLRRMLTHMMSAGTAFGWTRLVRHARLMQKGAAAVAKMLHGHKARAWGSLQASWAFAGSR